MRVVPSAQNDGHFVGCASRGVERVISKALAVACCWRYLFARTLAVRSP